MSYLLSVTGSHMQYTSRTSLLLHNSVYKYLHFHQPFRNEFLINPSGIIASTLPATIPTYPSPTGEQHNITLIRPQQPIKVSYQTVINEIPPLLTHLQDQIDIVLHIGMATGREFYCLERRAHRDGYNLYPDVDGHLAHCENLRSSIWRGLPAELTPSFDTLQLFQRWRDGVPPALKGKLRPSDDAGFFLCEFIYYTSLAWFQKLGEGSAGTGSGTGSGTGTTTTTKAAAQSHRPVLFLHVPDNLQTEAKIEEGRQIVIALIRALVECCGKRR